MTRTHRPQLCILELRYKNTQLIMVHDKNEKLVVNSLKQIIQLVIISQSSMRCSVSIKTNYFTRLHFLLKVLVWVKVVLFAL